MDNQFPIIQVTLVREAPGDFALHIDFNSLLADLSDDGEVRQGDIAGIVATMAAALKEEAINMANNPTDILPMAEYEDEYGLDLDGWKNG